MNSSRRFTAGIPLVADKPLTPAEKASNLSKAQEEVLRTLSEHSEVCGTVDEIRATLGLRHMTKSLFKDACNGLKYADQAQGGPKVLFKSVGIKRSPQRMRLQLL